MSKRAYAAVVSRNGDQWAIEVPDVPGALSLVTRLAQADAHIREAISFVAGVKPDSFDVAFDLRLPGGLENDLHEARVAAQRAEEMQSAAAEQMRLVVKRLDGEGISGGDMSIILGVSKQRVSQLLASLR